MIIKFPPRPCASRSTRVLICVMPLRYGPDRRRTPPAEFHGARPGRGAVAGLHGRAFLSRSAPHRRVRGAGGHELCRGPGGVRCRVGADGAGREDADLCRLGGGLRLGAVGAAARLALRGSQCMPLPQG